MRLEIEQTVTTSPLVESEFVNNNGFSSPDFETLLKNGIAAAQSGDRERARALLVQVVAIDPGSEDAWMWLASISEYPEELLSFLNRVLEIDPENERAVEWRATTRSHLAKTFVQRAVAAHEQGSSELTGQFLDQALSYDNDCEMAWFWKASVAASDEQKIEYLERVLEINSDNQDASNAIESVRRARAEAAIDDAKVAAVGGKRKKAIEILDGVLQTVPDNVEAWILKSHMMLTIEDKIDSLEKALEVAPNHAAARSGLDFLTLSFRTAKEDVETGRREAHEPAQDQEKVEFAAHPTAETMVVEDASVEHEAPLADDKTFDIAETPIQPAPAPTANEACGPVEETVDGDSQGVDNIWPSIEQSVDDAIHEVEHDPHDMENALAEVHETKEISPGFDSINFEGENESADVEPPFKEPRSNIQDAGFACPFCTAGIDSLAFECASCHATLTLSDIESLLSNPRADRDTIQQRVTQMEAEWNLRDFSEGELTTLGIAHFNLNNFDPGFKYLQEALRLNPNNVILSGQVNAIAIRLDEMRRHDEIYDSMPQGKTILVVDDSPTVLKLISGKLEKSGHHVVCAVDGVEALERLEESLPDLVLLDIAMPRMDGYEVCKQIRLNPSAKDLPVVMISGKDGFFDKVRGRVAGATGYVTKPFGPETLMKALGTYLLSDQDVA